MSVLTRQEAVIEMIEGAITALENQRLACAITLAGAAEGATPLPSEGWHFELFSLSKDDFPEKSEFVAMLNVARNWLKHTGTNDEPKMELGFAAFYVLRAISKYAAYYGPESCSFAMRTFDEDWQQSVRDIGSAVKRGFESLRAGLTEVTNLLGRFGANVRVTRSE